MVRWIRGVKEMALSCGRHAQFRDSAMPGPLHRTIEQWRLLASNGITAEDYYFYGLYRRNIPWRKKQEFLGDYERWRWQMAINPAIYHMVTEDKAVFNRYMRGAGIPVPRLHGVIGPKGCAENGRPLGSKEQVRAWLRDEQIENIFFKPIQGSRGAGVLSIGHRLSKEGWQRLPSGTIGINELLQHLFPDQEQTAFVAEELLSPHPDLVKFAAGVLHTARVITLLDDDVHFLAAVLRIGTGTTAADNLSGGNLAAPIDISSGIIRAAAAKDSAPTATFSEHPVTGAAIKGSRVPDWFDSLSILRLAAKRIPFNPVLGWDVGFTDRGPRLIEANDNWDFRITQLAFNEGLLSTPLQGYMKNLGYFSKVGLGIGLS